MNVISNSDSSSAKSNLDINDTYDPVNNDFSTTDFGENNVFNSEAVLLLSESRGRGRGRGRGHGRLRTRTLKEINKPKPVWTQTLHTSIIHAYGRDLRIQWDCVSEIWWK
jgi:hypothetical protein